MTEQQLNSVVDAVLAALPAQESPIFSIPVESSARHVHLTGAAIERLFGAGAKLTQKRALSQPGEFLSEQRVKIVTQSGIIDNVAVLGPARKSVQVELSMTDTRALGIAAPVRLSGDLRDAADVILIGPEGVFEAKGSTIVAQNHVHMTPADAQRMGIADGQELRVRVGNERIVTFERVIARLNPNFTLAMHIDFDEANACGLKPGDQGQLLGHNERCTMNNEQCMVEDRLITEARAKELVKPGGALTLRSGTIVTPSARDIFTHANMTVNLV